MPRFRKLLPLFLTAALAAPCHAALERTFDLTTLCFRSTDVVEAQLTRHHIPGQEDWKDTFTATVLNPLKGIYKAGDRINRLDLDGYDPARTGQHCLLFLTRKREDHWMEKNLPPVRLVDMLLVDRQGRVRRYFQWSDPGGLVADGFSLTPHPPTKIKTTHSHGAHVDTYQENSTFEEDDRAEQKYPTLAEERLLITSRWAFAKKLKTPPYQVLHQTER